MILEPEIKLFLQIVKGNGANDSTPNRFDSSMLIRHAIRHKVVYHVMQFAQQHKELFTVEQLEKLENRSRKVALQSLTQLHELKRISGVLNEKDIRYVCIKGPQLSRMIYGREALKESVDLDILLADGGDLPIVHKILDDLGYHHSNLNDYPGKLRRKIFLIAKREVHYFNRENRCAIDLHIRPGANTYLTEKNFKDFLSVPVTYDLEGTPIPVLQDESYLVYLCYHGALHQFARLAWLLDIRAFLLLKNKTLDWGKVFVVARSLRIERCVTLALVLLNQYFGDNFIKIPDDAAPQGARMRFLVSACTGMMGRDPKYGISLKGRAGKILYIMALIKGAGKIDWVYGIFMRQIAGYIARRKK